MITHDSESHDERPEASHGVGLGSFPKSHLMLLGLGSVSFIEKLLVSKDVAMVFVLPFFVRRRGLEVLEIRSTHLVC
jgi:hypothetical protein